MRYNINQRETKEGIGEKERGRERHSIEREIGQSINGEARDRGEKRERE